jgi:hypothetical protein
MPRSPEPPDRVPPAAGAAEPPGPPTQSLGIREAHAVGDSADPTRRVHPDSVPLSGAPQPSRRDQVMPTAEPVVPEIDAMSKDERSAAAATHVN